MEHIHELTAAELGVHNNANYIERLHDTIDALIAERDALLQQLAAGWEPVGAMKFGAGRGLTLAFDSGGDVVAHIPGADAVICLGEYRLCRRTNGQPVEADADI